MNVPNANNPLEQLRDIQLPEPVSWWPLAAGWWVLVAVGLVALVAGGYWVVRRHQRRYYRRLAQRELDAIFTQSDDATLQLERCSELLKRVALSAYGQPAASLSGERWVTFLTQRAPSLEMNSDVRKLLVNRYQPNPEYLRALPALQNYCQQWFQKHQRGQAC